MRNVKWFLASALLAAGILFGAGNHVDAASVKIDEKTFPDACVRASVDKYDINKDGILSDEERGLIRICGFHRIIRKAAKLILRECSYLEISIL